jgi:hypothetical protein
VTAAKAYAALAGSIATALLGVFTGDTLLGQILTVVSVVATAFATYQIPNEPEPRRRRVDRQYPGEPGQAGLHPILTGLLIILAVLAILWFLLELAGRT